MTGEGDERDKKISLLSPSSLPEIPYVFLENLDKERAQPVVRDAIDDKMDPLVGAFVFNAVS